MCEDPKARRLALDKQIANKFAYKHMEPITKTYEYTSMIGILVHKL